MSFDAARGVKILLKTNPAWWKLAIASCTHVFICELLKLKLTPGPVPCPGIFAGTGTFVPVPASAVTWLGSRDIYYQSISCATCVPSSRKLTRENPSIWEIIYIHANSREFFCTRVRARENTWPWNWGGYTTDLEPGFWTFLALGQFLNCALILYLNVIRFYILHNLLLLNNSIIS